MPRLRFAVTFLALTAVPPLAQAAPKLTTLYAFKGGHDGAAPVGRLLAIGHTLYGATAWGGLIHQSRENDPGNGSLFAIDLPSGAETVLYRFDYQFNGPRHDARGPVGGLVNVGGVLYGTSVYGGRVDYGTLFSYSLATGAEAVLHSFTTEGIGWASELTLYHASLYGVMPDDGKYSDGLVFKYDPKLTKYSQVYSFGPYSQGVLPVSNLTANGGVLFGTTDEGGAASGGTAFSLDPKTRRANIVYAFQGTPDGRNPGGNLVLHDGNFYGVTLLGGETNNGTVFELTRQGTETVLYSFKGGADGGAPRTLMLHGGALYGTSSTGGGGACTNYQCGTIFKFDLKSGAKTTIHSFTGGADGWGPSGALISFGGALYGTTEAGGRDMAACQEMFRGATGCGTVFKLAE